MSKLIWAFFLVLTAVTAAKADNTPPLKSPHAILEEIGKHQDYQAYLDLQAVLKQDPDNAAAYFWEAVLFDDCYARTESQANLDDAYQAIQKAVLIDPNMGFAPPGMASAEYLRIQREEAGLN